jgi:hypothetical protein
MRLRCMGAQGGTTMQLNVIDYATMAFIIMSVAFSPALVWVLVWMAAPAG